MQHPLQHFLNPQSVAIIGVSPNPSFISTILNNCIRLKFPGQIFPINPNYPEIAGLKTFPRVTDVPSEIDLALISVPARIVPDTLLQCEEKKVKAVNIITSGFEEVGGDEGQRRHQLLTDFVKRTGIRIVGPNCFGNLSVPNNFPGMAGTYPALRLGKLSLAFQSGGLAINLVSTLFDRHIGLAHAISSGNEVDVEFADCLRFFAEDEQTQVIGCFVEQFRNPEKFLQAAEMCADARKPIVMIKIGRSEAGQRAAQAHTGSLVGSDNIIDAVLKKHGITRVYGLDEMVETMAIMHARKMPKGKGVGAVTFSGGAVGVLSDMSADYRVMFPPIHADGQEILRKVLYEYGSVNNPIDLTGQAVYDPPVQQAAFDAMGSDPNIHTILIFAGGNARMDAQSPIGKGLFGAINKYPEKLFVRSSQLAGTFREKPLGIAEIVEPVSDLEGVPFMQGLENTLRAVRALISYAEFLSKRENPKPQLSNPNSARRDKAIGILRAANGNALTESEGKSLLALYGIPVTQEQTVQNANKAAQCARHIGFPVAMKIVSPQIMHKTEAGGVALNIANEAEARAAFERIMQNARRYNESAELHGVSVQELIVGGNEMIVGMTSDPQFGPGIVLGLGGIFVEVLKDVVMRVPPLSQDDAHEMIDSLKGAAILKGARGKKPTDIGALSDTLVKFSQLCLELRGAVKEIDINPLIVMDDGCGVKAVDCLIVPA